MRLDDEILQLYRRSRELWLVDRREEAEAIYRRLRAEHSVELYPAIDLHPDTRFVHPLGTVLGRAAYAANLVVYQGVSVGSTVDHERPWFQGPVVLFPHSGVIGPVTVGSNVWITAGTIVEARPGRPLHLSDNTVVFRKEDAYAGCAWTGANRSVIETFFGSAQPRAHP